jgi:hypothetical protein
MLRKELVYESGKIEGGGCMLRVVTLYSSNESV